MKKESIENKSQKRLKGLSKAISVIAIILKVFVWIAIVSIGLLLVATPFILKDVKVVGDKITYKNMDIDFEKQDEKDFKILIKGKELSGQDEKAAFVKIKDFLDENSITKITISTEILYVFSIGSLIIVAKILSHVEQLFKNINEKDSPFIEENVIHLFSAGKLMIAVSVISIVIELLFNFIYKSDASFGFTTIDVVTILVVFALAYIFEYGMLLQKDSKKKIYS